MNVSLRTAVFLFGFVMDMTGQTTNWANVRGLAPGTPLTVVTRDGTYVNGKFHIWSDTRIEVLRGKSKVRSFAMTDVHRVQMRERASRWKGALWGAILGFAAAFPCGALSAGYVTDQNNPGVQTRVAIGTGFGLFGAGIGAAVGALAGGSRSVTLYRAGSPR